MKAPERNESQKVRRLAIYLAPLLHDTAKDADFQSNEVTTGYWSYEITDKSNTYFYNAESMPSGEDEYQRLYSNTPGGIAYGGGDYDLGEDEYVINASYYDGENKKIIYETKLCSATTRREIEEWADEFVNELREQKKKATI